MQCAFVIWAVTVDAQRSGGSVGKAASRTGTLRHDRSTTDPAYDDGVWTLAIVLGLALGACNAAPASGGGGDPDGATAHGDFDPKFSEVRIEIDYETGQQPYTGQVVGFGDAFDLSAANLDRIFAGTRTLELPRTLGEMKDVGEITDEEITVDDMLALAAAHRDQADTATVKTYYVLFVSGHFADASGVQSSVLGVALSEPDVVVMFKDVIRSTASLANPNAEKFVEQSTLIHELGHAVGLVGLGVVATSAHEDSAHGAHCTNDSCVMYWLNEGASTATQFALQHAITNDSILFGPECLADVDALTGGP